MSLATPRKGYKSVPWLFGKEIEIPDEWEVKKCSKTLELKHGYQFRDEDFIQGGKGIKIIKIGNLKKNGSIDSNNCDIISLDRKSDFLNIVINSGDVLMALTGATLGKIIQVPKINEILLQNYRVGNFFPKKDIDKNFLYYVLKNIFTQKQIWFLVNSGAQPNIGKEDFDKIKIICPPLPEQQKIATILSNVDNLIESTEKVITHSKKVKTGLMQKLLTRGIGHTKFKKVPWLFGKEIEIPEEWEIKNIKDIFKLKSGSTPARTNPELFTGNIPWVTSTDLNRSTITSTIEKITEEAVTSSHLTIFSKGTFFIATYGLEASKTRGKCGIIEMDSTCNQACMAFLPSEKMTAMFLFYFYLHFGEKIVFSIAQGTKQQNLYSYTVGSVRLLLPPISEQQKIASILSNIDDKITSQEKYKEKLEKLKKSLMQKLLTGEVRV